MRQILFNHNSQQVLISVGPGGGVTAEAEVLWDEAEHGPLKLPGEPGTIIVTYTAKGRQLGVCPELVEAKKKRDEQAEKERQQRDYYIRELSNARAQGLQVVEKTELIKDENGKQLYSLLATEGHKSTAKKVPRKQLTFYGFDTHTGKLKRLDILPKEIPPELC